MNIKQRYELRNTLAAGMAALALATSPVLADEALPKEETLPRADAPTQAPQSTAINESLVGANVFTVDGANVGEVEDIMRGDNQQIVALRLSIGGFLGLGARQVMVRPEEANVQSNEGSPALFLDLTEAELQQRIDQQGGAGTPPPNGIR